MSNYPKTTKENNVVLPCDTNIIDQSNTQGKHGRYHEMGRAKYFCNVKNGKCNQGKGREEQKYGIL